MTNMATNGKLDAPETIQSDISIVSNKTQIIYIIFYSYWGNILFL